ncbi:30S ribosomal protein S13 [Candidatus Microgenomates bacterium]|jgi:small subunit ribosomal protein S13|nr:MAG: 30S ribosomal protein S13 [Candidatus Microgenomates bacterium]
MPRISGVDIPEAKRIDIALTAIYGIGRSNVESILSAAKIESSKKVKELNEEEINRIQKAIDGSHKVEGDLRKEIQANISRLRQTGTYRGKRHAAGLPARGQRTRSNARTKRGRRMTIGALKKDELLKKQKAETEKAKA